MSLCALQNSRVLNGARGGKVDNAIDAIDAIDGMGSTGEEMNIASGNNLVSKILIIRVMSHES